MAYLQSRKTSSTNKQLQHLKAQLYGKEETSHNPNTFKYISTDIVKTKSGNHLSKTIDTNFLRHDLLKITLLASLIIGAQVVLYFTSVVRSW